MKKFNKVIGIFSIVLSILIVSCIYPKKWNINTLKPAIEEMLIITTVGEVAYDIPNDGQTEIPTISINIEAAAIPLKDNYILALTHCTELPKELPTFFFMVPVKVIKPAEFSIIVGGESVALKLIGRFEDISLFKSPVDIKPYPVEFSSTFDYEPGTEVLSIGFSFALVKNIKDGVISHLNPNDVIEYTEYTFMHSIPTNSGDSGTPILVQDIFGDYKIIGIIQSGFHGVEGIGFALRSDYIVKVIELIKFIYGFRSTGIVYMGD